MNETTVLFTNGNILTLDGQNSTAGSVAVSGDRITGIWQEADPPEGEIELSENTQIINLRGKTMLPGFVDTHNHILMYGMLRDQVDCSTPPNKSISDILEAVKKKAGGTPKGEWVEGYGYDDTLLAEKRHPTRSDLDQFSPDHPVFIRHISGHLAVANSLALEVAGLDDDTDDPESGHFGRDEHGKLNGVLYEPGPMKPILEKLPSRTADDMVDALEAASKDYLAQGITTNTDAAVGNLTELEAHLKAANTGRNPMRTQLLIMHTLLREGAPFGGYSPSQLEEEIQERSGGLARLDGAKIFQDGSIQGLTGALRKPYYKHPELYGDFIHKQEAFDKEVADLHQRGFRIATHGNGDRAIGSILDAYERAITDKPRKNHKHRIEHVQTATPEDLDRMEKLEIAGSFFINHVYYWGDRHEQIFLGPERARRISPLAEAVEHGLLLTLHSDCPVTPISPLFSVWAAVNRVTRHGKVLGPEQRIDVITALKAMTIYGSKLISDEKNTGSIEVGKKADFAILEDDPVAIDPERIKDIQVNATFIDGKVVYGKEKMLST